jgi:hypothetical protein
VRMRRRAEIQKREVGVVDDPTPAASAGPPYHISTKNVRLSLFKRFDDPTYLPPDHLPHRPEFTQGPYYVNEFVRPDTQR